MAWRCDLCGKGPVSGSNVSFSERHTKRRFKPNLVAARVSVQGEVRRMKVCTRCLRTSSKSA